MTPTKATQMMHREMTGFLTPTRRAALYARVSTEDQQSLPMQIAAMREYAARCGWPVVLEIEETGSAVKPRPRRAELMRAATRRDCDVIVVWRLDRWARSLPDFVATMQELEALGVAFVSLSEALDFTTPAGRAMAAMISIFAQFEREIIRERINAGIAEARKKGKHLGRPVRFTDYTRGLARDLLNEGKSKHQIAKLLNVSRSSVIRLLKPVTASDASEQGNPA